MKSSEETKAAAAKFGVKNTNQPTKKKTIPQPFFKRAKVSTANKM